MSLFTYIDAKTALAARLGHRSDITDAQLQKYLDQAQFIFATNVLGCEGFDRVSSPCPLVLGQSSYSMSGNWGEQMPKFWAISHVRNDTDGFYMRRGEFETYLSYHVVPDGVPTMWIRNGYQFFIFQAPSKATTLTFYYRAQPDPGVYQVGDDWFDGLVQLAQYYALAEIGKGAARQDVKAGLPGPIQVALTSPLSPMMWESVHDSQQGVYPGRF
jgi:hypothetical protein